MYEIIPMRLIDDGSYNSAYYKVVADKLEELSNIARSHSTEDNSMVARLKAFADEIRSDMKQVPL